MSRKWFRKRRSHPRLRSASFAVAAFAALGGASQTLADNGGGPSWGMIGNDPGNSRDQPFETAIGPSNVGQLTLKWVKTLAATGDDVSATPAVVGGAVYFPDWVGTLWKLDAATGQVIWSHSISDYTGIAGDLSRSSPTLAGTTLVIGDLKAPNMMGIDAKTGALRWITRIDPDPNGIMTGSPVIAGDTIYVGVSQSGTPSYPGALVALQAQTGQVLWRSWSLPNPNGLPGGYAGSVMFASPSVDLPDGLVFATFKSPNSEPASVAACNAAATGGFSESCEQPGAFMNSVVAFDTKTGNPVWSYRVRGPAPWTQACGSQPSAVTWCAPEPDGVTWDLGGSAPNVFQIGTGNAKRTVVGVGEKSGVYILLDAKTGTLIWSSLVGPGGDQGGMEWGTAYDGNRIYVSLTNQHHLPYKLTEDGTLTSTTVTGGSWAALDPTTGKILWQTADPQTESVTGSTSPVGVWDLAPVTVANGVLYAGSMAKTGNEFYALDATTGAILWSHPAGGSVNAGPAVVGGTIYWGSGYSRSGAEGSGDNKFFAFSLPGH